jgi:transposase-like protein
MEDYPETLIDFENRFSTEEACRSYLYHLRWPNGYICPRCGHTKAWPLKNGLFRCSACFYKVSVIAGTIFEGTRKSLTLWFRVIWLVTSQKNGASAKGLQKALGLGSYKTAWTWLHKLRRAMVRPGRDRLSGTIEVDETYIGGEKPGKRGRGALVIIAAQNDDKHIGRIRLRRVLNASAESLEEAVLLAAEPGSVIKTDGWRGYKKLADLNYIHEVVRKKEDIGDNLLPACNKVASLLKRWLLGTHQGAVSHDHLDYYLDEFTFRFNRRTSHYRGKLFYRLIQQAMLTDHITYQELIKGDRDLKPKNTIYSS